jgi:hypothetical protein
VSKIGTQIEAYSPLLNSTGYVISRLEVTLLLGLIPSITPTITKVSNPNISLMINALKGFGVNLSKFINNEATLISKLEEIEKKFLLLEERFNQANANVASPTHFAQAVVTRVQGGGLESLQDHPESKALIQDAILLLSSSVKNPTLAKLLDLIAKLIGGESLNFRGYEMKDFSIDIGFLPAVSFSLVKM